MAQTPDTFDIRYGDGSSTQFSFNFPYLKEDEVFVDVAGEPTGFTLLTPNTVEIIPAPEDGAEIYIYRNTAAEYVSYQFQLGAPFLPRYVDENFSQLLYSIQEGLDFYQQLESRSVRVPEPSGIQELPDAETRANKFLSFDENGNPSVLVPAAESAAGVAQDLLQLKDALTSNTPGQGSDLIAYTGTDDTVTEALGSLSTDIGSLSTDVGNLSTNVGSLSTDVGNLATDVDKRVLYVGSVAELEALSLPVGTSVYLTEEGRAGNFVVKSGTPPSDPQKGVYIALVNGGYAERVHNGKINIQWFGAVGNRSADSTSAINAAITFANSRNVGVYAPAGEYIYAGGADLSAGVIFEGVGRNATTIVARDAAAAYLFKAVGYGSGLRNLRFQAGVTQTGGKWVWLQAPESFIDDFFMDGDFNGIYMTGNVSRIRHGRMQDGATGATRIISEGGDNSQIIDDVLMGAQLPQVSEAGIRVRNSSALMITNTSVIQQGVGLLIDPVSATQNSDPTNGSVFSLFVNNCFFDNSGGSGIRIQPSGTASVVRSRFSNVWCGSSSSDGVSITNSGTGQVSGLQFNSLHAFLNGGSGMSIGGSGEINDIEINGGSYAENSFGMFIDKCDKLKIRGATVGASSGLSGNPNGGIAIGANVDNFLITDNILLGNGAFGGITGVSFGVNKLVRDNIGYATENGGSASVTTNGAGEAAIAHGLDVAPNVVSVFVQGDNALEATVISVNGTNINVRVRNTTTNADVSSASVNISWSAKRR